MKITGPIPNHILEKMDHKDREPLGKAGLTVDELNTKQIFKSERELQEHLKALLDRGGIWYHWSRMDRKTTCKKGTPDFIFCVKGKFVAWEVKFETGTISLDQIHALSKIESNYGVTSIIRSYEAALKELNELQNG